MLKKHKINKIRIKEIKVSFYLRPYDKYSLLYSGDFNNFKSYLKTYCVIYYFCIILLYEVKNFDKVCVENVLCGC